MTRIRRIIADKSEKIGFNPLNPRHPRSITAYTNVKNALASGTRRCAHFLPLCTLQNNNVKKEMDIDEPARTFA
jgi:hypothetical protein